MIKVSAPGNLFFLGEHAVVYGHPAICTAINRRTYVTIDEKKNKKISIKSDSFGSAHGYVKNGIGKRTVENKGLEPLMDLIHHLIKKYEIKNGFDLVIDSEIPVESGMSSSTAVLSAVLCAVSEAFKLDIKKENYFDILYPFQVNIHGGKASGSEIISSSLGGFNRIQKIEKDGKATIDWKNLGKHEFSVVVGNTKIRSPTALTVGSHIPSLMNRKKGMVEYSFKKIGELADAAEIAISKDDAKALGNIMNRNQGILTDLMVSHPKLDDCIHEALDAGALGAKLSGSGWGGVMFALCREEDVVKVAKAISSTGSDAIVTDIGVEGVRIEI